MGKKLYDEGLVLLADVFLNIKSHEELFALLEDLCTPVEIVEMSRRILAAKLLRAGVIYSEIGAKTGLSAATISRVNRSLKYGADGYETMLKRLEEYSR